MTAVRWGGTPKPPGSMGGDRHPPHLDGRTHDPGNERRLPLVGASPPRKARRRRDWTAELRASVHTADELARALPLTAEELEGARRAEHEGLPIRITPYYLGLVDRRDPRCPIRLQCIPRADEAREVPGDMGDPLARSPTRSRPTWSSATRTGPSSSPPITAGVYCRFCTRSRMVGDGGGAVSLEAARAPPSPTSRPTPRCATSSSAAAIR